MQYGNCFFGALFLLFKERKNNPKFIMKYRPGTFVPHFMVRTKDKLYHYNLVKDIFCWPFCYLLFRGEFQAVNISEEDNYGKH